MHIRKLPLLLPAIVAPLLASCIANSSAETPSPPAVNYSVMVAGDHTLNGQPANRKIEVFADQTAFNSSLYLYIQPIVEQKVDFSSRRVVLFSLGQRGSGGHSIAAEAVEDFGEYIKVKVVVRKPGSNCIVTQSLTSPYQFIEIQSVKDAIFEERVEVTRC